MVIKKEREIKADPKTVWIVLTNPAEIKKWLGVEAKSDWASDRSCHYYDHKNQGIR